MTNVIFVGNLDISERIFRNVRLGSKRKVSIILIRYVLSQSLTEVPHNSWWIDSGCTSHVSNMMQGFLSTRIIKPNEKFVFSGNRMKVAVEVVGTYCLIFDTGFYLDLMDTFYVPSISRNLVSLSKLDVARYSFKFGNGYFSLYKCTCLIGSMMVYTN